MNKKNVFITGGAGGLGRATSHYLAERGWHVFAADFDQVSLDYVAGFTQRLTPKVENKLKKRGYNQSEWIAKGMSVSMEIPLNIIM